MTTPTDVSVSDFNFFFGLHRTQTVRLFRSYCEKRGQVAVTTDDLDALNRIVGLARSLPGPISQYDDAALKVIHGAPGLPFTNIAWWNDALALKRKYAGTAINIVELWEAMQVCLQGYVSMNTLQFLELAVPAAQQLLSGRSAKEAREAVIIHLLASELRSSMDHTPLPADENFADQDAPRWFYTLTCQLTASLSVRQEVFNSSPSPSLFSNDQDFLTPLNYEHGVAPLLRSSG